MKLALDASAYRALGEGDPSLAERTRRAEKLGLPIIVLGELWFGFTNGSKLHENTQTLERWRSSRLRTRLSRRRFGVMWRRR